LKKPLIYILIVLMLLAGGGVYYFYFYDQPAEKPVISQVNTTENDLNKEDTATTNEKEETETGTAGASSENGPVLAYRETYRNPFKDYNTKVPDVQEVIKIVNSGGDEERENKPIEQGHNEPAPTEEMVRRLVPFQLTGLIGTEEVRLAIVEGPQGSVVISKGDEIEGFIISDILSNGIIVEYQGVKLTLDMGSDDR